MKQTWWILEVAAILLAGMILNGCAAQLMSNAIQQGQNLTPEQIKAYNETGAQVYGCFQIGGPAVSGNTQWVILPKGVDGPHFGDNCHIIQ